MYEMGEQLERVVLAGVQTYDSEDTAESLLELEELTRTAGAVTVGSVMQSRESVHPATYLGKGKLEELKEMIYNLDATGVICDDELTPAQLNNLERELECKVMDRTMVILDIFAGRARTSEGKIQVELAQLKYRARPSGRNAGFPVPAGRRDWNPRSRREETGDGPPPDSSADRSVEGTIRGSTASSNTDQNAEGKEPYEGGRHRGIYQCRKIHLAESTDRSRSSGRGSAFCHAGPHHEGIGPSGKTADSSYRYGGIYTEAAPSSDRSF